MKYRISQFFSGRNGFDRLSKTIMWPALFIYLISGFVGVEWLRYVLYYCAFAALVYVLFRVLSRDLGKRQAENDAFTAWLEKKKKGRTRQRTEFEQRKTHCFFTCPGCGERLRVPKGRGKLRTTCRQCGRSFEKHT